MSLIPEIHRRNVITTLPVNLLTKYFPEISEDQLKRLEVFHHEFAKWNSKINLVSRQDMEHFEERHLLSSLAIAKYLTFPTGSRILDVGTGGGLPGVPLAIAFPDCQFTLIDSIGKKINAVQAMADTLQLANVTAKQIRAEALPGKFDFITGRAVKSLPVFISWIKNKLKNGQEKGIRKGVVYLKGGDLRDEIHELGVEPFMNIAITDYYPELEFFDTKRILHFAAEDLLKPRPKGHKKPQK